MSDYGDSVWGELDDIEEGIRGKRLRRTEGYPLAAAVWELAPGSEGVDFHFHHGTEELLIVLRGRPILRTGDSERQLQEGEVVHFPPGPQGAHTVVNRSEFDVRYVMVGAHASPDIIEYPDKHEFVAAAWTPSQDGDPFFVRLPFVEDDE